MIVLCCGDRNWRDSETIQTILRQLPPHTHIIHGAARGADQLCSLVAKQLGLRVTHFNAEWDKYGRSAGPIRNSEMLKYLLTQPEPRRVLAFHSNIEASRGTKDMLKRAKKKHVPIRLIRNWRDTYDMPEGWVRWGD